MNKMKDGRGGEVGGITCLKKLAAAIGRGEGAGGLIFWRIPNATARIAATTKQDAVYGSA